MFAALALAALALHGCGGGGRPKLESRGSATTTTTSPANEATIAVGAGFVLPVYKSPTEPEPEMILPNPWFVNDDPALPVKQVLLVVDHVYNWYKVLLPIRPNGRTGWVKSDYVKTYTTSYRIIIELAVHRITVWDDKTVILQERVATGSPVSPTPTGKYYLRVLLQAPNPDTVYGPYAYPLSGHSDVFTSFDGGDGELGIHGNNDESVLGQSITHGCIRMSNVGITRITKLLPLGTPVEILP
jgi:lipoprotein-anchoring transpeptidase ErfK/SrfK